MSKNFLKFLGFQKAKDLNDRTYLDYYDRLKSISLSLFEWQNLPESCNERFLEMSLYEYGKAIFIDDPELGFLTLKCNIAGNLNVYDEAVSYIAYSINYNKEYDRDECVLIRNNYMEQPTDNSIRLFALRLAEAERTIDVNIKAQKTPVLVRCDDKDRLTMKNLYAQYDGNEPFILGSKSLNAEGIKVFKTDAPFVADRLQEYKRQIWNEALTFLGVNNTNTDKRERLITDEVNANNEQISIMAHSRLLTRKEACEKINKKYGLELDVRIRTLDEIMDLFKGTEETEEETEGSENG